MHGPQPLAVGQARGMHRTGEFHKVKQELRIMKVSGCDRHESGQVALSSSSHASSLDKVS